ncbi:MAG: 4-hydroxy-3-methylbut-2-enyl diphosphate reductase, partial [Clostridia bacterium]
MPVTVAKHAGFCMGVHRAVDEALQAARGGDEIVTFGELVHNPQVIEKLEAMHIFAVHCPQDVRGKTVIIRSHGIAPAMTQRLRAEAKAVIDLTCPFVARLHDVVDRYSADGSPVILVGQADHPEVVGTIGCAHGSVYTLHSVQEAAALPQLQRALAVSQTTFPQERWEEILPILREHVSELTVQNTICTATVLRQAEARKLAAQVDAMLVVGGKTSANTRKLYETCKSICERTLLVERAADIPPGFANIHS